MNLKCKVTIVARENRVIGSTTFLKVMDRTAKHRT